MFTVYLTLSIYLITIQQYSTEVNQCSSRFVNDNGKQICILAEEDAFSWINALNRCRTQSTGTKPFQIVSVEQLTWLQKSFADENTTFWLGANNFFTGEISKWHWLNGLDVDNRLVQWCDGINSDQIQDVQCLAYESKRTCVRNYPCHSLLPVLCVSDSLSKTLMKASGREQTVTRSTFNLCASSLGDAYANWWTYSILLLNWFLLLCFFLNLCNRFMLERNIMISAFVVALFSFITIVIFSSLWGVQSQDLARMPLVIVILGCISGIAMLLVVVIILFNRNRVQRWTICMVILCGSWVAELFLMLGIILCIADCSGYVDLASTSLEKDIIASLLATLVTAISILCQAALTYIMQISTQDRPNVVKPTDVPSNTMPLVRRPTPVQQQSQMVAPNNLARTVPVPSAPLRPKSVDVVERSTSPVDYRILAEFYSDLPQDVHSYSLDGRQYRVYEGHFHDIESYRKDLIEAMLIQSSDGLREAIRRAKSSMHARELHEEIEQAENLASKIT